MIVHLIANKPTGEGKVDITHQLIVEDNPVTRPSAILTDDAMYIWGAEYKHFPGTGFYLQVALRYYTKDQLEESRQAVLRQEIGRE